MLPESRAVLGSFLAAYRSYVDGVVRSRGVTQPADWQVALDRGHDWLEAELGDLLAMPLDEQRRSPLELFQEAMRFPTDALQASGVEPADRDATARQALPGDLYALAPASSQDLGDAAWQAHLAWGVAKAKLVGGAIPTGPSPSPSSAPRRPVVALVATDVMDRSQIESTVRSAGLSLDVWRNPAAIQSGLDGALPVVVLVDLVHPAADAAIRAASAAAIRTYAYGPHVDDIALVRARSLGATDALARSRFFRRLPELLPTLG